MCWAHPRAPPTHASCTTCALRRGATLAACCCSQTPTSAAAKPATRWMMHWAAPAPAGTLLCQRRRPRLAAPPGGWHGEAAGCRPVGAGKRQGSRQRRARGRRAMCRVPPCPCSSQVSRRGQRGCGARLPRCHPRCPGGCAPQLWRGPSRVWSGASRGAGAGGTRPRPTGGSRHRPAAGDPPLPPPPPPRGLAATLLPHARCGSQAAVSSAAPLPPRRRPRGGATWSARTLAWACAMAASWLGSSTAMASLPPTCGPRWPGRRCSWRSSSRRSSKQSSRGGVRSSAPMSTFAFTWRRLDS